MLSFLEQATEGDGKKEVQFLRHSPLYFELINEIRRKDTTLCLQYDILGSEEESPYATLRGSAIEVDECLRRLRRCNKVINFVW